MRPVSLARGPRDRALGRFLVGLAAVSALMGVVSGIVGVLLVTTMRNSVDDSLDITGETLDTVSDSITLSSSIVDTLRISITNVSTALTTVQDSLDTSATTIGDVGTFLGGPLSDTLDTVSSALPTLQSTAGAIDDTLGLLDRIPFGPNYSPDVPLSESIGQLAQAVGPLPEQLRGLDKDFTDLQTSADEVSGRLGGVITDVDSLVERLDGIDVLLGRYQDSAAQAKRLTSSSRGNLDRTASLAVMFAVLISLLVVGSQVVPLWLGRRLQHDESGYDGIQVIEPETPDPVTAGGEPLPMEAMPLVVDPVEAVEAVDASSTAHVRDAAGAGEGQPS